MREVVDCVNSSTHTPTLSSILYYVPGAFFGAGAGAGALAGDPLVERVEATMGLVVFCECCRVCGWCIA